MKYLSVFIILFNFSLSLSAQVSPSECFKNVEFDRTFIALDTHRESELVSWYQKIFGMNVLKKFESKNKTVRGVILQKNNLYVEILHNSELSRDSSNHKAGPGIQKAGFFVDQPVEKLKNCLQSRSIETGRIFHDHEMGMKLLRLTDPEGNDLEIISKE